MHRSANHPASNGTQSRLAATVHPQIPPGHSPDIQPTFETVH